MNTSDRILVILAFFVIYFVWGTTYLAIVIGLHGFPPFFMAAMRFLIAGVLLVGFSLYKGEKLPDRSSIVKNAIIGLVVLTGGQGLLIWSEQYIASGYASVLIATLPIWFVVMDRRHWTLYFSNPFILAGIIIGFAGITMLFRDQLVNGQEDDDVMLQLLASVAVLAGGICWVGGTLYHRSHPAPGSMQHNLGWQLLMGAAICMTISGICGEYPDITLSTDMMSWAAVIYLALAGSIAAFIAYTWLLERIPSAIVGTYAYINPVVAVFLGWLLADEKITAFQLSGMSVVLVSAILINVNRNKVSR
ncbi:EamA family transporter [Marinoscillum furvescens]|uniref:Drug/metabolite transporter (DMT)-like permease n=1 Tax=Marinoscillum furvescens DSM 4134 TaxID=1122208 RepID=A0A3D9L099_MARFU|nr:EamA family transporter [Marinoscillum furvescens]RED96607.1 drug/metabolite transporter (DMT)-like permease [Marinoscillum furvescens DSM 4134]